MDTYDFLDLMREAWPIAANERHPLRTPLCPALPRILAAVKQGWSRQEREHVDSCEYCQRVTAMVWEENPPAWSQIIQYAASPASATDNRAMSIYAERGGGRRYAIARKFVETADLAGRMKGRLAWLIERAAFTSVSLPMPKTQLAQAQTVDEPFAVHLHLAQVDIELTARKNPEAEFEISAFSSSDAMAGAKIHVDVVGASAILFCELILEPGNGAIQGSHSLGPFDPVIHKFGAECLIAAYLDQPSRGK